MGLIFESSVVDILLLLTASILYLYYFATKRFNHWKRLGIKYIKPIPFFGNTLETAVGIKSGAVSHQDMYNTFPDEKYFGIFMLRSPTLFIRDPAIIHRILIKDFSHFYNRGTSFDEELDPLSAHLVNLTDQRWKNLRYKLTPVFSSGKLKTMYNQLEECANEMEQFFSEAVKKNNLLELRESMAKFSTDVIGSCAFGLQFNALKDPDSEFRRRGREIFRPSYRSLIKFFLRSVHPSIPRILKLKLLTKDTEQFYLNFVKDTVQQREANNIKRNDFIQLLIEIRKEDASGPSQFVQNKYVNGHTDEPPNKEVILDDKLMAANAFVFFLAGFETTASTMAYCLLELAANLDVQEKMRQEVLDTLAENDGNLTYDIIKNMPYMENVISETLRKYPVASGLIRECTKTYQFPDSDYVMEKGTRILIPVYAIHHDPQYYPDPERFDPERFSEENKKMRPQGTYLPFGDGPRICIGLRFAMMEMKIGFCKILPRFEFRLSNKMKYPLEYNPKAVLLTPLDGIWLNVYERK